MNAAWNARPVTAVESLPERLPTGERVLWQGAPDMRVLLRHAFHVGAMVVYFGLILAWCSVTILSHGGSAHAMSMALLHRVALACVPFVLVVVYAWAIQRSTTYTITSRRVVIGFGLALPVTYNLPFSRIEAAGLRLYAGGAGDIPLRLLPGEKMSYFVLWPHVRPWRMARAEPMLRCVADAAAASTILGDALAAHEAAAEPRVVAVKPVRLRAGTGTGVGALGRAVAAE